MKFGSGISEIAALALLARNDGRTPTPEEVLRANLSGGEITGDCFSLASLGIAMTKDFQSELALLRCQ